jgi:hypothetical protein
MEVICNPPPLPSPAATPRATTGSEREKHVELQKWLPAGDASGLKPSRPRPHLHTADPGSTHNR